MVLAGRRVLVTGGAGFLGVNLVERLVGLEAEVTVVDNMATPSPIPPIVEIIEADVRAMPDFPEHFDVIFHLAATASPPRYLADPVDTLETSAEGTRAVLDLAAQTDARLVFTSTSEVYGDPDVHPQPESYVGAVDVQAERACYDEGKRYAEALIYAFRRMGRYTDGRIARIFNTYGPGMDPNDGRVVSNFLTQALAGEPLSVYGDGSQTRSLCYVDDLIDGLVRLAQTDDPRAVGGPINLGSQFEVTVAQLADLVASIVGDTGRRHARLPEADPARRRPDTTLASEVLDWEASTPIEVGLAATAEYFRSFRNTRV